MSIIVHGGCLPDTHRPEADTFLGPEANTPLLADTQADTLPTRRLLQWTVSILLECILVHCNNAPVAMFSMYLCACMCGCQPPTQPIYDPFKSDHKWRQKWEIRLWHQFYHITINCQKCLKCTLRYYNMSSTNHQFTLNPPSTLHAANRHFINPMSKITKLAITRRPVKRRCIRRRHKLTINSPAHNPVVIFSKIKNR